jgi:hypothetical protein
MNFVRMKLNINSSLKAINDLTSDLPQTLSKSKELLDRLSEWHQEFLQQSQKSSEETAHLCTVSTLGYHYIQMTIFRAIIRPFIANPDVKTPAGVRELARDQQDVMSFARTGVRSATTSAANFVKGLKEEHFHMFWPHWSQVAISSICFLDLLMASSSLDTEEAKSWFRDLHDLRKEMRLKSNMLPILRLGLLRIDAVFWKGVDNVLRLQPHIKDALQSSLYPSTS